MTMGPGLTGCRRKQGLPGIPRHVSGAATVEARVMEEESSAPSGVLPWIIRPESTATPRRGANGMGIVSYGVLILFIVAAAAALLVIAQS